MGQNRSSAVMQQRSEPHDSLDDFPTPPWATRALCEWITAATRPVPELCSCREPAANRGHMVKPLREAFGHVIASDVFDYGADFATYDYLFGPTSSLTMTDWTITNPPFKLAEQFIERALMLSRRGVAMFVRSAFLESIGRYERLFSVTPPTDVLQFSERVVLHKGRLAPEGSTATAYCWLVWRRAGRGPRDEFERAEEGTSLHWIPPCRDRLEREGDYPAKPAPSLTAQAEAFPELAGGK
jgi:hypothetical protein